MTSTSFNNSPIVDRRTAKKRDADEQIEDARAAKRAQCIQAKNLHVERNRRQVQDVLVDRDDDDSEHRALRGIGFFCCDLICRFKHYTAADLF